MGELGQILFYAGAGAWILFLAAMQLPVRRAYRFKIEKWIAAPPERVWKIYDTDLNDPESKALYERVLSKEQHDGNPPIVTTISEHMVAGQRRRIVVRYAVLLRRPPEIMSVRMLNIGGKQDPYGLQNISTSEFSRYDSGTLLRHTWEGELATLGQRLDLRNQYSKFIDRLAAVCERKPVASTLKPRNPLATLAISVLAIVSFAIVYGWIFGALLSLALVVHEFGHWLAMRLTGQPAPRVMLLPFLGGVTIANHPHKTYFNDAFCALMGAGFSALPALALLLLMFHWNLSIESSPIDSSAVSVVALSAFAIGAVNLLQLMPFLPLDGGQVLRAIMQSFSARWAKLALLAIGGAGVAAFIYFGEPLLAGIVGIGVLQSWHMPAKPGTARPMSVVGLAAMICAFLMTAAIHGSAAYYGLMLLRQLPG
jgi:Zn-dependent protease